MLQIIDWISWEESNQYKSEDYSPNHVAALVEYLKKHPEMHMSGAEHQQSDRGVPLFSDRSVITRSMRSWGQIMADVFDNTDPMAYCDWAWVRPDR